MTGEREFRFDLPLEQYTLANGQRGGSAGASFVIKYPEGTVHSPQSHQRLENFFQDILEALKQHA